jgi:branched-chain amino acid transport system substrate-binding protein
LLRVHAAVFLKRVDLDHLSRVFMLPHRWFAVSAVLSLAACGPEPVKTPVRSVASAFALTGPLNSGATLSWENAALLAEGHVNAGGGIGAEGRPLAVERVDTESNPTVAVQRLTDAHAANKLSVMVAGLSAESAVLAPQFALPNEVVMISAAASAPGITALGAPYFYRTSPSGEGQMQMLAKHAYETLGYKKVALAYVDDAFGKGMKTEFAKAFIALGGAVLKEVSHPSAARTDYNADLEALHNTDADAIMLASIGAPPALWLRDYQLRSSRKPLFFPNSGYYAPFYAQLDSPKFEGFGGTALVLRDGEMGARFEELFKPLYGDLNQNTACAYDALMLAALAVEASGKDEPMGAEIRAVFPRLQDHAGETVGVNEWAKAKAALKAGKNINYVGASGEVDFEASQSVKARFVIWKVQAGKLVDLSVTEPF